MVSHGEYLNGNTKNLSVGGAVFGGVNEASILARPPPPNQSLFPGGIPMEEFAPYLDNQNGLTHPTHYSVEGNMDISYFIQIPTMPILSIETSQIIA